MPPVAAQAGVNQYDLDVLAALLLTAIFVFAGIFAGLALLRRRHGLAPRPHDQRRLSALAHRAQRRNTSRFLYLIQVFSKANSWWRIDWKAHLVNISVFKSNHR